MTQVTQDIKNIQNPNSTQTMILAKPVANENISMPAVANLTSITLQFESSDAEISKNGDDLIFFFADGSSITINDYFTAYNIDTAPSFVMQQIQNANTIDMISVDASDFLLAVSPDAAAALATAAGPAAGANSAGRSRPGTDTIEALVDGPADPIGELSRPGLVSDPEAPNLILEAAGFSTAIHVLELVRGNLIEQTGSEWITTVENAENKISDIDSITAISEGKYGSLSFDADDNPIYLASGLSNLVPGQKLEDVFIITRTDANGNSSTQEFRVSILGNNLNSDIVNIENFDGNAVSDTVQKDFNGEATNLTLTEGTLSLGEKSDTVTVNTVTGGVIDTGADNDIITVGTMTSGYITSGNGDDIINIINIGGGDKNAYAQVTGGAGDDIIAVANVYKQSVVYGGDGNDTITAGDVNGGIIESDGSIAGVNEIGNDQVTTGKVTGGHIRTGVGNDTLTINGDITASSNIQTGSQLITTDLDSGFLTDTNDNDILTINGSVGTRSQIFTGTGKDEIVIAGDVTGKVMIYTGINYNGTYDGVDNDTLIIQGNLIDSKIYTRDDADNITIEGSVSGNAMIEAGYGDDVITVGGDLSAKIYGNSNSNNTHVNDGNDTITIKGSVLSGGVINSGVGNDIVSIGGSINDTIDGGNGYDTIIFGSANDSIMIDKNASITRTISDTPEKGQNITNFESINGGAGDDTIDASKYAKGITLFGGAGSDTLTGGAGKDTFAWDLSDLTGQAIDTIKNFSSDDMLLFDKGISVSDVTQVNNTNNCEITLSGNNVTQTVVFENSSLDNLTLALQNAGITISN